MSCPRCGGADALEGLCAGCLLLGALAAGPPPRLGGYELLEIIGRGGMGVVHRARQVDVGHVVALKRIRGGELATDEEVDRFMLEAKAASRLHHPNIVRIYHVEEHDGRPYFTMELLDGGSLDREIERFRREPRAAAKLVATVARAVHYGHDRGVLHRDLKPANILLDADGTPRVADFGVAKVHGEELATASGIVAGTPHYMAPEQAAGSDVTRATDVWSLGAVLYELLAGVRPFDGATPHALMRQILEQEPPRLRGMNRDLETICRKCLEKDPARRYSSAARLADDLERFLRAEPIEARPLGGAARVWRWGRRHPLAAALGTTALMLLVGVGFAGLSAARAQERELRQYVVQTNVYAARALAGGVLFQLRELAARAEVAATDPAVVAALVRGECVSNAGAESLLVPHGAAGDFDSMSLFDRRGRALRRWPPALAPDYQCNDFSWRDYARGATRLGELGERRPYFGRALQSEGDHSWKFSVAVPVYAGGDFVGFVNATLGTRSALGRLPLVDPTDVNRTAMLVAPRDNERADRERAPPDSHLVLLHPRLRTGSAVPIDSPHVDAIQKRLEELDARDPFATSDEDLARADADFRDPLSGDERWLAGLAPVGLTGYVVIAQTRDDAALALNERLLRRLAGVLGVAALAGLAVTLSILWLNARRRL